MESSPCIIALGNDLYRCKNLNKTIRVFPENMPITCGCRGKSPVASAYAPVVDATPPINLSPAIAALGLTEPIADSLRCYLRKWLQAGMPERTESEQEPLKAYCRSTCLDYGPAAGVMDWPEQCLHGCTMVMRKREGRPPLTVLWRLATSSCPAKRWAT